MNQPTVRDMLRQGIERLREAGVPDPGLDARLLLAEVLGVDRGRLSILAGDAVSGPQGDRFGDLIAQRGEFRPVSHILGRRAFWRDQFQVTDAVLDPRPETELIVELALSGAKPTRILDLGTGSGAILLSLLGELPAATGVGVDVSAEALAVAGANGEALGLGDRAQLVQSDWFEHVDGAFDLVVSNPPYIPDADVACLSRDVRQWEPRIALTPGDTGLEAYQRIAQELHLYLTPGGRALFEIGAEQGAAVSGIFAGAGYANVLLHQDINGRDRVIELKLDTLA